MEEVKDLLEQKEEEIPYLTNWTETKNGFRVDIELSKVEDIDNLELSEELQDLEEVEEVDTISYGLIVILKE